ncbi:hypothetical protein CC1G_02576 [Coprinopsis cinerea okayama7|uniref:Uncharacterized protein n=1 Tax=Coprinopsis cinerea (strain Okayama-7 / 130 / ATCC MYA-4618 / FGSC 9003) TaxID=240176 RepID=A8PB73_COPC7|nr:hypothetical protein CC1G_02576 [Coprinopsis cinerea okayama7\|eukprot:XP_001840113.1 hypothetical protein CC1G_02576 [Coprinopsis cinerea okayama7\
MPRTVGKSIFLSTVPADWVDPIYCIGDGPDVINWKPDPAKQKTSSSVLSSRWNLTMLKGSRNSTSGNPTGLSSRNLTLKAAGGVVQPNAIASSTPSAKGKKLKKAELEGRKYVYGGVGLR